MASASKSTTLYANTGAPYSNATLTASFNENSTSTSGNTSSITVTATQKIGNADWSTSYTCTLKIYWYDNNANSGGKLVKTTNATSQGRNATITASGTITVAHKSDGSLSGYAKAVWTKAGNSNWTPNSGSISTSDTALTKIPRAATLKSADNFNDTGNPKITYSNAAGNSVSSLQARIENAAGNATYVQYRDISKTGTSYTFNFTDAERNVLLAATPNSKTLTVKFVVRTILGGNTFWSTLDRTMTVVDANPTFTATYRDTNSDVLAITNDNQLIVRNQSELQINVKDLSAKKSATIASVTCLLNGTTYNGTISGTSCTFNIGTINVSSDTTATITVTDSRGFSTSQNLNIQVLDWVLPSAIITMQRHNNFYSNTDITVDGSISSVGDFNVMAIKLRYKKVSNSTWSSYVTMQDNVTQVFDLNNEFEWDVQVVVSDRFGSTTYNLVLSRGMPIIFFDRIKSSVGFNCFPVGNLTTEGVTKDVMTRSLSAQLTNLAVSTYTIIPLDLENSCGARLTATNDGGIKIGSGISKVLISGKMAVEGVAAAGNRHLRICKNSYSADNTLGWAWDTLAVSDAEDIIVTPQVVDVEEDDVIYLYYWTQQSSDKIGGNAYGGRTCLTVEVVG